MIKTIYYLINNIFYKIFFPTLILILFIMIIIPLGLLLKLMRINLLEKKFNKESETYWIARKKKTIKLNKLY